MPDLKSKADNFGQLTILLLISLFIIADKMPVLFDYFNHKLNYRLHDGFGDAITDISCCFILGLTTLSLIFKNKKDFTVSLIYTIIVFISATTVGLFKFMCLPILSLFVLIYCIRSIYNRSIA